MLLAHSQDTAEILKNDKIIAEYLQAALEENDPAFFVKAVGNVARAKGMTQVAQNGRALGSSEPISGSSENLYKALSGKRDLRVSTLMKVLGSLGILGVQSATARMASSEAGQAPGPLLPRSGRRWRPSWPFVPVPAQSAAPATD